MPVKSFSGPCFSVSYLSILYTVQTKLIRVTIHCLWRAEVSCRLSVACFSLFLAVGSTPMKAFGLSAFYLGYLRYSLQGVSFSFLFLFWFTLSFFFCFFFFEDKIFGLYYSNLLTIAGKQLFTCDT